MSVTLADIEAARRVIAGHVLRTPMLPAPRLSALTGADGLPCRLELAAAAGLLGLAGAGGGAALLGRGLGTADLSPTVVFAAGLGGAVVAVAASAGSLAGAALLAAAA